MVYTIRNSCEEDNSVFYNDGARKIFLYTKGKAGNPSQELKDMLKYIENSTVNNITNHDIASINHLVDKIKHKKEVGINYMKSWEYEKWIKDEAYKDGFSGGYQDGMEQGIVEGIEKGIEQGIEKINKLTRLLAEANRTEDIIKAANDKSYLEQLLQEFNLK